MLTNKIMKVKVFFQKLRRVKKRKLLSKSIGLVITAWTLKYGAMNSNRINSVSPPVDYSQTTQPLKASYLDKNDTQSVNLIKLKTGSGTVLVVRKHQNQTSEASKSALEVRCGDFRKSGAGGRAKADARRNARARKYSSGSTLIPGADALVPQNTYCRYHQNAPLSCKPRVKLADGPFQGDGDNNQPPPENGNFDSSQYKGGPNPFLDKFDYDNPNQNHTRENTYFSSQKRMNHAYDRHAEKCFGMKKNRNKENLKEFEGKARSFIESPKTEKINGSYRYETPAYFYKEKDGNLVAIVNATDNSFITVVNATESQLESIQYDHNFGLDTRPSMQLQLRLRGPKIHN